MENLTFNHNWNGKLNCNKFTTIRLWNDRKYFEGAKFKMYLKKNYKCDVEVVGVKKILISQINDWMAWLDTGYSAKTTQELLREMYKNKPQINWNSQALAYLIIKRLKNEQPKLF